MATALRSNWIAIAAVAFVLLNGLLMARDHYWLNLLPAALLCGWAMVASLDRLTLFIAFATPLSVNLEELELGGIGISLPTEPLMVGVTLLFLLKVGLQRGILDERVLRHPVTLVLVAQLVWMAVCIVPSSMPLVSAKAFLARVWFTVSMYFVATRLFEDGRTMHRFFWAYLSGLVVVMVYTLVRHSQYGFAHDPGHWVMEPFFKDHTSYGAVIAFFLPFGAIAAGMPAYSRTRRAVAVLLFGLLITALVVSYTRAAWVSLVGALLVFLTVRLRVPGWLVASVALTAGAVAYANLERITIALERNREESSDDLGEHVRSISNITSDASNLERINRWNSALRMWQDRPVFGWGPGTYMFQYAPYQASSERTIISTNFGIQGNAHSEYLGPLSEQGLPGLLIMLALVAVTCASAVRTWLRMPRGDERRLLMAAFLGLITYYLHGILNNFLDLDKAAVPFWAFTAMVVLFDVRYGRPRAGADARE
jgi:O-antigen ligase